MILRSQLLVLLQRRHFCDKEGRPVGREPDDKVELELEVRVLGVGGVQGQGGGVCPPRRGTCLPPRCPVPPCPVYVHSNDY